MQKIKNTMLLVKCVLLLLCYQLLDGWAVSEFTPNAFPAKIFSQCGQYDHHCEELLLEALQQVKNHIQVHSSCESLHNSNLSAASGYYQINATNGSVVQVYCDMEGTNCGGEGGWTRVVFVNMTKPGATCPQGLEQLSLSGTSYCGRFSNGSGCVSAVVDNIISYRQVCGRVLGYQRGGPDAFDLFIRTNTSINQVYFDGLAIMHGGPRKHIWTYTAGFDDNGIQSFKCPCNSGSTQLGPPYIGNDYYCESGGSTCTADDLFSNDILWDGQQCNNLEAPCCTRPNMPWFIKTLNEISTDVIELRACQSNFECLGSVPIFLIELYVR